MVHSAVVGAAKSAARSAPVFPYAAASALDLEAFVFAATRADPGNAGGARAAADEAYRVARGSAALEVADAALSRLDAGDVLGVIG